MIKRAATAPTDGLPAGVEPKDLFDLETPLPLVALAEPDVTAHWLHA